MGNPTPAGPAGLAARRQCSGISTPILVQDDRSRRHRDKRRKPTNGKFIRATESSYGLDDDARLLAVPTSFHKHPICLRVVAPVQHLGHDARPPRGLRAPRDRVDGLVGAHGGLRAAPRAVLGCPVVLARARRGCPSVTGCPGGPLLERAAPEKLPERASAGPGGTPVKRAAPGPECRAHASFIFSTALRRYFEHCSLGC